MKFTIITATYNCLETLPACLDSIKGQNYTSYEHIIIDGVSSDGTTDFLNNFTGSKFIFISEPDEGIYDALNKGIQLATGDVIGFLHADDIYASKDVLSKIAKAFENPSVCAVYGDLEYVGKINTDKVIRRWRSNPFVKEDLNWGWMPAHPTFYVRREWYSAIGGFDASYKIAADYHSVLKLFSNDEFVTVYLPDVLITMRMGGASNKSLRSILKKTKEDWRALRSCNFGVFAALQAIFGKNIRKLSQFTNAR
jgi:glycosyltransferase involved in cell wall biosynthesis